MVKIKDLFVPEHCIQGDQISSHLLWAPQDFKDLRIKIPKGWKFIEVFNVGEEDIKIENNELLINKTQLPGYFAFEVKTSKYNVPNITKEMIFTFNGNTDFRYDKKILLFRSDVKIKIPPEEIVLSISEKGNYGFSDYIKLVNLTLSH